MSTEKANNEKMELGISQLLGFTKPNQTVAEPSCEHAGDGMHYQEEGARIVILRCIKCNEFYDQIN